MRSLEYIKENGIALESDFSYPDKDTICISDLDAKYFISEMFSTTIGKMPIIPGSADHARPVKGCYFIRSYGHIKALRLLTIFLTDPITEPVKIEIAPGGPYNRMHLPEIELFIRKRMRSRI